MITYRDTIIGSKERQKEIGNCWESVAKCAYIGAAEEWKEGGEGKNGQKRQFRDECWEEIQDRQGMVIQYWKKESK